MTSIRIAIAAALVLTVGFAGGTAHTNRGQAPAPARPAVVAGQPSGPVLCC